MAKVNTKFIPVATNIADGLISATDKARLDTTVPEAPADGRTYCRKDTGWVEAMLSGVLATEQSTLQVPSTTIAARETTEVVLEWDGPPEYCEYVHVDPVNNLPLGISYRHHAEDGYIKLHISNSSEAAMTLPLATWKVTALLDIPADAHSSAGVQLKAQLLDGTMNAAALETAMATPETQAAFTELMSSITRRRELFNDPEAMAAIAGSAAAMTALSAHTSAFKDLLKNAEAMTTVAGSATAVNAIKANTAATNLLAASIIGMTAYAASSTAMNIIANHEPTLIIFKASSVASGALMASEAAMNILLSTPLGEQYFGEDFVGICMMNPGLGVNGWVRINKDGNTITMADPNTYFASHPLFATTDEIIDGQVLVKFKKGYAHAWTGVAGSDSAGKLCLGVSSRPVNASWKVHPAFYNYDTGSEIDQFWLGKYTGSLNGSKIESQYDKTVKTSITLADYATACRNRNVGGVTGFHLNTYYEHIWGALLLLIKVCSGDLKTALGYGASYVASNTGRSTINAFGVNDWNSDYAMFLAGISSNAQAHFTVWTPGTSTKEFSSLGFTAPTGWGTDANVFKSIKTGASSALGGRDMALLLCSDNTGTIIHMRGMMQSRAGVDGCGALSAMGFSGVTVSAASWAHSTIGGRLAKW